MSQKLNVKPSERIKEIFELNGNYAWYGAIIEYLDEKHAKNTDSEEYGECEHEAECKKCKRHIRITKDGEIFTFPSTDMHNFMTGKPSPSSEPSNEEHLEREVIKEMIKPKEFSGYITETPHLKGDFSEPIVGGHVEEFPRPRSVEEEKVDVNDVGELAKLIYKTNMVLNERRAVMLAEMIVLEGFTKRKPELAELDKEKLLGVVAQGWCTNKNKDKCMDADLAMDIAEAVYKTFGQRNLSSVEEIYECLMNKRKLNCNLVSKDEVEQFCIYAQAIRKLMETK